MTRSGRQGGPGTPVSEIARLLEQNAIKRVPITVGDNLVGIVSRATIIQGVASLKLEASPPLSLRIL
jgi:predicted transcriptional regulator